MQRQQLSIVTCLRRIMVESADLDSIKQDSRVPGQISSNSVCAQWFPVGWWAPRLDRIGPLKELKSCFVRGPIADEFQFGGCRKVRPDRQESRRTPTMPRYGQYRQGCHRSRHHNAGEDDADAQIVECICRLLRLDEGCAWSPTARPCSMAITTTAIPGNAQSAVAECQSVKVLSEEVQQIAASQIGLSNAYYQRSPRAIGPELPDRYWCEQPMARWSASNSLTFTLTGERGFSCCSRCVIRHKQCIGRLGIHATTKISQ
jgi:hypothetical protein